MVDVEISDAAREDLVEIDDYGIAHFGMEAADLVSAGFEASFSTLARYPLLAPARSDYGENIRCKMYGVYRILYRFDGAKVVILRVMHHSRNSNMSGN